MSDKVVLVYGDPKKLDEINSVRNSLRRMRRNYRGVPVMDYPRDESTHEVTIKYSDIIYVVGEMTSFVRRYLDLAANMGKKIYYHCAGNEKEQRRSLKRIADVAMGVSSA